MNGSMIFKRPRDEYVYSPRMQNSSSADGNELSDWKMEYKVNYSWSQTEAHASDFS